MKTLIGNKDGYIMSWVLLIMLVLSILLLALLSIAADYHAKVVKRQNGTQAYYTARSMAELAAGSLTSPAEAEDELALAVREALAGGETSFEIQVDGMGSTMGSCVLTVESAEGHNYPSTVGERDLLLVITAIADCRGSRSQVAAVLSTSQGENPDSWQIDYYR